MENIKYIFFDIGYTLVNEDKVWKQRCLEQSSFEEAIKLKLSAMDIYNEIIQASISYKPQFRTVIEKFKFMKVAEYRYELEELYSDAINVMERLSQKYKLGIIANQGDGLVERLDNLGMLKCFSREIIISSWDYKVMKPDTKLFEIALLKAGCKNEEAVMIGDRLDNDIYPANLLGMKTIWIKQGFGRLQKPRCKMDISNFEVSNLSSLLEIFRQ